MPAIEKTPESDRLEGKIHVNETPFLDGMANARMPDNADALYVSPYTLKQTDFNPDKETITLVRNPSLHQGEDRIQQVEALTEGAGRLLYTSRDGVRSKHPLGISPDLVLMAIPKAFAEHSQQKIDDAAKEFERKTGVKEQKEHVTVRGDGGVETVPMDDRNDYDVRAAFERDKALSARVIAQNNGRGMTLSEAAILYSYDEILEMQMEAARGGRHVDAQQHQEELATLRDLMYGKKPPASGKTTFAMPGNPLAEAKERGKAGGRK